MRPHQPGKELAWASRAIRLDQMPSQLGHVPLEPCYQRFQPCRVLRLLLQALHINGRQDLPRRLRAGFSHERDLERQRRGRSLTTRSGQQQGRTVVSIGRSRCPPSHHSGQPDPVPASVGMPDALSNDEPPRGSVKPPQRGQSINATLQRSARRPPQYPQHASLVGVRSRRSRCGGQQGGLLR